VISIDPPAEPSAPDRDRVLLARLGEVDVSPLERGAFVRVGARSVARLGRIMRDEATFRVKSGLAEMLKGGVIMDVVDAEQAESPRTPAPPPVMALERVPSDIRRDGGVARMSTPR
jgi:hypothetical protein